MKKVAIVLLTLIGFSAIVGFLINIPARADWKVIEDSIHRDPHSGMRAFKLYETIPGVHDGYYKTSKMLMDCKTGTHFLLEDYHSAYRSLENYHSAYRSGTHFESDAVVPATVVTYKDWKKHPYQLGASLEMKAFKKSVCDVPLK